VVSAEPAKPEFLGLLCFQTEFFYTPNGIGTFLTCPEFGNKTKERMKHTLRKPLFTRIHGKVKLSLHFGLESLLSPQA
jgi:hypothetical protein